MLAITQRGGGPTDAVRQYVLAALRRVHSDRLRFRQGLPPADDQLLLDPGAPLIDNDLAGQLIVRAFMSLPERWSAVLWLTEVERAGAAQIAPVFDLTRNGVAAARRRAKFGLRHAYLQIYLSELTRAGCQPTARRLGAFIGDSLSARETGEVSDHLTGCADCRAVCAELADISTALRETVAPVILGGAAAAYLAGAGEPAPGSMAIGAGGAIGALPAGAAAAATGAASPGTGGGSGAGSRSGARAGWPDLTPWAAWAARPSRWLAAAVAAVLVIAAVAVVVAFAGHDRARKHDPVAGPRVTPRISAAIVPIQSQGVNPGTPAVAGQPAATPSAAAGVSVRPETPLAPSVTPAPAASPTPAAVQLAASVSVSASGKKHVPGDQIVFQVSDTGSAATGEITVSLTLPAGSLAFGGHHHDGGWTCQPSGGSATCQHDAIAAGSQAQGTLWLVFAGSGPCGQPVQLTASSGAATASASSGGIPC